MGHRTSDILGGLYEETGLLTGVSAAWPLTVEESDWHLVEWYAKAVGQEVIRRCYGWPGRPRPAVPGERVWAFQRHGAPVAWSAARPDPTAPVAWLTLGIWPEYQRQGWAGHIRTWTAARALIAWPVDWVGVEVLRSNAEHLRRWLERTPTSWQQVGQLDIPPPGSVLFAAPRNAILDNS